MFILDRKFDPNKHVFEFAPLQGNLGYVQSAMERFEADKMALIGMTSPGDVLNPEVMKDGNSGYKLQLAMGPNQLIQDEMVKNCAIGVRDAIYLVWKTMIQYADDFNIQQLAFHCSEGKPFMDAASIEKYEFIDRKMIKIDLALGFMSDENRLTRQKMISAAQVEFTQAMMQIPPECPEMFEKVRRPYEDTLRVLGVKNIDSYLPTMEEAMKIAQATSQKPPTPEQQEITSKVALNQAKAQKDQADTAMIVRKTQNIDFENQMTLEAARHDKVKAVEMD